MDYYPSSIQMYFLHSPTNVYMHGVEIRWATLWSSLQLLLQLYWWEDHPILRFWRGNTHHCGSSAPLETHNLHILKLYAIYTFLRLSFFHAQPPLFPTPVHNASLPQHPLLKIWRAVGFLHPLWLFTVAVITYVKTSHKNHRSKYAIWRSTKWSHNLADLAIHFWWLLFVILSLLHFYYHLYPLHRLYLVPCVLQSSSLASSTPLRFLCLSLASNDNLR